MKDSKSESYAAAGVDVTAGYESVELIKPMVKSTYRDGVIGGLGGFGGMFDMSAYKNMKRPVTVSGTDGVGTKLKIAFLTGKHDTIGIDGVAMCVNDIVCAGAEPLFFLDYIAMGKNVPSRTAGIVSGIVEGCRQAGCALIGGETAEHPGMMPEDEYDIGGFSVGVVEYDEIIDGSSIKDGDVLIGLASSGVHSNGFSLVRKALNIGPDTIGQYYDTLGCTLGEELIKPTKIYVKPVLGIIKKFGSAIKGISHITGGGFYENVPRMLPEGIRAKIDTAKYPALPIFDLIQEKGNIPKRDMYNTFNMGIGMVIAVDSGKADEIVSQLKEYGESPYIIGVCASGDKGVDVSW
jgi:phosphoribosylformylglycinamidine cyclo-ligase